MKRWPLKILGVLSQVFSGMVLALFVASLLGWANSYRAYTAAFWCGYNTPTREMKELWFYSRYGTIGLEIHYLPDTYEPMPGQTGWHGMSMPLAGSTMPPLIDGTSPMNRMGFAYESLGGSTSVLIDVYFPWWLLALLLLPLVAWRAAKFRRYIKGRRGPPKGRCTKCGYDLRASKDRCPECGMVFVAGAEAKV